MQCKKACLNRKRNCAFTGAINCVNLLNENCLVLNLLIGRWLGLGGTSWARRPTSGSRDVLVAVDGEFGNEIVGRRFSVEIHVRFQAFGVLVADGWTATTGRQDGTIPATAARLETFIQIFTGTCLQFYEIGALYPYSHIKITNFASGKRHWPWAKLRVHWK